MAQVSVRGGAAAWLFRHMLAISKVLARRNLRLFGRLAFRAVRGRLSPSLYRLVSGGAALDEETELALLGLGYDVLTGYGLSETGPIIAFNRPGRSRMSSAGQPLPGVEARIARPDPNGVGEIEVRGPNVFSGYLHDEAATNAAFTDDGWFRTRDRGRLDRDGYLYVYGRAGDVIVLPGGKKVVPEAVETHYAEAPEIGEIAVLAEEGRLVGLVVPSAGVAARGQRQAEVAIRAALAAASGALPGYAQLAGFAITAEPLPRTQIGKLRRHLLPSLFRDAKASAERGAAIPGEARPGAADFFADPEARRVWDWLEARFRGRRLSPEMNPRLDLGIDSLGWLALTMDLEQSLGLALDEAALARVVTLRDFVNAATKAPRRARQAEAETAALPEPGPVSRVLWYAGQLVNRLVMRLLFRLKVEGLEHLPQAGAFLLCPNHTSYLDAPALAAALPTSVLGRVYWAGSTDILFSSGWRRAFSRAARVLAVDPQSGARSALALSVAALRQGPVLVWFPEGWRSRDGTLQPFFPGAGALALQSRAPVVPVRIEGTYGAWPPQRRFPRPGRVRVRFGEALDPKRWEDLEAGKGGEERVAMEIRQAVAALDVSATQRGEPKHRLPISR
jgi:long-chain acyl-CoA synthetase